MKGTIFKIKRFSIHDGPGIRTSVFLKGCPLKCTWCHSPEGIDKDISIWYSSNLCIGCGQCTIACNEKALELIKLPEPFVKIDRTLCKVAGDCVRVCPSNAIQFTGKVVTTDEVVCEIMRDVTFYKASGGGVTLTGGEPFYQPDFTRALLKNCRKKGIHTTVETCLYSTSKILKSISEYVDLFIIDIKIADAEQHSYFTGKPNEKIKNNFRYIADTGKSIIVRIPLIENITDTTQNLDAIEKFVHEINENIPIEYIKFNPLTRNNYDKLGIPFLLNSTLNQ